jgi:hypothetical protein
VEEEVMEEVVDQEEVEVEVDQNILAHTHPTLLDITEEVTGEVEVEVEGGVVLGGEEVEVVEDMDLQVEDPDLQAPVDLPVVKMVQTQAFGPLIS